MDATKALRMLDLGQVRELQKILTEEIFIGSLSKNTGAKERYTAMKRYIEYSKYYFNIEKARPCEIEYMGEKFFSFLDGHTAVLTREDIGDGLTRYDSDSNGKYFNVAPLFNQNRSDVFNMDLNEVIAEAKSKGYKFKKKEVSKDCEYYLKLKDAYFKIGLIDKTFSVINDGNEAEISYFNSKSPIQIKNDLGLAVVLPVSIPKGCSFNGKIIIERMG